MAIIRELSFTERTLWGYCPVCGSGHGVQCDRSVGQVVGVHEEGKPGAHLGRLSNAPHTVITQQREEEVYP